MDNWIDLLPGLIVAALFFLSYKLLRSRNTKRKSFLVYLFLLGIWFFWLDYRGWRIENAPPSIAGVIVIVGSVLGMLGVNIWRGGPLDPRRDS